MSELPEQRSSKERVSELISYWESCDPGDETFIREDILRDTIALLKSESVTSMGNAALSKGELRPHVLAEPPSDVQRDAKRWRALIGCARVRVMGSAGIHDPKSNYAHIVVEFWTHHKAQSNPRDIETILKFVERAARTKEEHHPEGLATAGSSAAVNPREVQVSPPSLSGGLAGETSASRCDACLGDGKIEYGHPNAPEPARVEQCKACDGTGVRR